MESRVDSSNAVKGEAVAQAPVSSLNREVLFTDTKGQHQPRLEKMARAHLKKAAPILSQVLEEGEQIQFATHALAPISLLEFLTTGWVIFILKRSLLVVTDRRILHFPGESSGQTMASVSQVRFEDLERVKVGGFFAVRLRLWYRNGKKETFSSLPQRALQKLKALLPQEGGSGPSTAVAGRQPLCPRCAGALEQGIYRCAACGLEFKDRKKATWLSVLLPGGGYFYTGHPVLGLFDAVVECGLLLLLLGGVAIVLDGDSDGPALLLLFGVLLGIEKLVTVYHAHQFIADFLPKKKDFLRS